VVVDGIFCGVVVGLLVGDRRPLAEIEFLIHSATPTPCIWINHKRKYLNLEWKSNLLTKILFEWIQFKILLLIGFP
jgi:hypothetical protein